MIEVTDEMLTAFREAVRQGGDNVEDIRRDGLAAVLAIVERDIPVARTQIQPANRPRYAASAAPESIAVYLRRARLAQRAAEREVEWLGALLERRTAERDAGVWPPPKDGTP